MQRHSSNDVSADKFFLYTHCPLIALHFLQPLSDVQRELRMRNWNSQDPTIQKETTQIHGSLLEKPQGDG